MLMVVILGSQRELKQGLRLGHLQSPSCQSELKGERRDRRAALALTAHKKAGSPEDVPEFRQEGSMSDEPELDEATGPRLERCKELFRDFCTVTSRIPILKPALVIAFGMKGAGL
jgi:hypothetical protein